LSAPAKPLPSVKLGSDLQEGQAGRRDGHGPTRAWTHTRERLQRILECGFTLAATEGATTDWPKLPKGTTITVRSGGDSFLVDLRAANESLAEQVLKAALIYKPRS